MQITITEKHDCLPNPKAEKTRKTFNWWPLGEETKTDGLAPANLLKTTQKNKTQI